MPNRTNIVLARNHDYYADGRCVDLLDDGRCVLSSKVGVL